MHAQYLITIILFSIIIPKIINGDIDLLNELRRDTVDKKIDYCKNIYIIKYLEVDKILCVYFSHKNKLYIATDYEILEYDIIKKHSKEKIFENIYNFLENNNIKNMNIEINPVINNIDIEINPVIDNMNIEINPVIDNMNIEINPVIDNIEIKNDIFNECEQIYKIYETEKIRKKKLEDELKIEEQHEKELLKKKRHLIQEKIIVLKGNFRTYKNIEKDILKQKIVNVPETFTIQYEYFEAMLNENKEIINNLDDLEIMNSEFYDDKLVELSLIFYDKIREFKEKLTFSHNWSELDNEYKTGSYSVGYNK